MNSQSQNMPKANLVLPKSEQSQAIEHKTLGYSKEKEIERTCDEDKYGVHGPGFQSKNLFIFTFLFNQFKV